MSNLESEQGFVNCGDRYVATDIDAIPGLGHVLEVIDGQLDRTYRGANYTATDVFNTFVKHAVKHLDLLVPVKLDDPNQLALF